ncbi:DUF2278 family protein [Conexibacter sp. JD483]|uniref:DUF2278 family protein n=1 Tax=unclassified Conexibacter TaxID=2627773 RepID=UPI0027251188|nr:MULTISPECIES: DUF2278 family protein [unclassified Conexibacter]MDO8183999.1 DUF2278 family protein [Conexibacter sp. CPCC 205706]MDO8196991.1 DUF2278 family protein [Conexibacter sp. CPCC 205762]MDR9369039.1 DUF2278 family protein [Conexibacter sp. JD483]
MPLKRYGVLRGSAVDRRLASGSNGHYQVHVVDETSDWRVAVNVESALAPSELRYVVVSDFAHPLLNDLAALPRGWSDLASSAGGAALDFIRANLFDTDAMRVLPFDLPGPDNDLNEKLDHYVGRAVGDEQATVYAFGERWGPEPGRKDKVFGFLPGNGVHDIHMNQGNVGSFTADDGVWQDGALLLHFPRPEQWVGIFLAFQSQGWHTDDATGHTIGGGAPGGGGGGGDVPAPHDGTIRIVAALVNALDSPEREFATLLNTTAAALELDGWTLADRDRHRQSLHGRIAPGETLRIALQPPLVLPDRGGLLTLLDPAGLKVDGVAYSGAQASEPGRTLVF